MVLGFRSLLRLCFLQTFQIFLWVHVDPPSVYTPLQSRLQPAQGIQSNWVHLRLTRPVEQVR